MFATRQAKLLNIQGIISDIFGSTLHKKRPLSLAYTALGCSKVNHYF